MKLSELFGNIEGFDSMDDSAKLNAIADLEFDNGAAEIKRLRDALDKSNSENAGWKRKVSKTEEASEKTISELADKIKALEEVNARVTREKSISEYRATLIKQGYDETLANETAEALIDNNYAKVLENQAKHQLAREEKVKAELLAKTPYPPAGQGSQGTDYAKLIDEAMNKGDDAQAIALMRLQAEANANNPNK